MSPVRALEVQALNPPMEDVHDVAGRKIRFLMDTNHVTVHQLAETLGIKRGTLQEIIDRKSNPSPSLIRRIARHFGVPEDYFTERARRTEGEPGTIVVSKSAEPLTLKTLAIRFQGLVELLIAKGVLTAAEYHDHTKKVEERQK